MRSPSSESAKYQHVRCVEAPEPNLGGGPRRDDSAGGVPIAFMGIRTGEFHEHHRQVALPFVCLFQQAPDPSDVTEGYLLVGPGVCGICGQPLTGYEAKGRTKNYRYYTCRRSRKSLGGPRCRLGDIHAGHLEHLVVEALSVLGKHPEICRATIEAMKPGNSASWAAQKTKLADVERRIQEIESTLPDISEILAEKKRPAVAERLKDRMEKLLQEQTKLSDEKRLIEAGMAFDRERVSNTESVVSALERMPAIFAALPELERKELARLLIQRIVVKPFSDEKSGICDGALVITPHIRTKRFSVKIGIFEKDLLSVAFAKSVDGSTLAKIGCPGWDRTSDQVINSHLLYH